ncbi:MAG: DUF1385 domain-containing protein [Myxococcota bacterium]
MENAPGTRPYVGGQAVIEGVMMRGPRSFAVAARRPNGTIVIREDAWVGLFDRLPFLKWPLLRGTAVLVESLFNGIQALNFSSLVQAEAERAQEASAPSGEAPPTAAAVETVPASHAPSSKDKAAIAATLAFSFVLALGMFVALPHLLAFGTGVITKHDLGVDSFAFHALDGAFKIAIFVAYIWAISRIPEIKRVFQYHGAEHMAINVYEHELPLTVENARRFTTFHARCGTSFILFVLTLSIFVFAAIFPFIPKVSEVTILNHLAMVAIKIPLMLPLAGLAYEVNRYAAKHPEAAWVQLIVFPGRLMQKLTTQPPSDDQLEIALAAMRAALRREAEVAAQVARAENAKTPAEPLVVVYKNFGDVIAALPVSP